MKAMKKLFFFLAIVFFFSGFSVNQALAVVQPPVLNSVTALSSCAIRLNWSWQQDGGDSADYFKINKSPTANGNGVALEPRNNIDDFDFENIDLPAEARYWYTVRAGGPDYGDSVPSNKRDATTLPLPQSRNLPTPVLVNNGNFSFGFDNDNRPALNWRLDSIPQNFNLYGGFRIQKSESVDGTNYGNLSDFDQALPFIPDNGIYSYLGESFIGASLDKNYKFVVKTLMSGGELCNNNPNHIVPSDGLLEIIVPRRPEIFQPRLNGQTFDLSWHKYSDGNDNNIYFELWRKANAGAYRLIETINNPNQESSRDSGIQSGNRYFYKIRACRNNYCSPFSAETAEYYGLPRPENLKVDFVSKGRNNEGRVLLSWQRENNGGDVYVFERATWAGAAFGDFSEIDRVAVDDENDRAQPDIVNNNFYYNIGLPLDQFYQYRVKVINGNQESVYSDNVSINLIGLRPVLGWSWSNFGWIKMNSENLNEPNRSYGVYVNANNRLMGYGWSSNAGWISFNRSDSQDCPDGACNGAQREGDQIGGWAKFLAASTTQGLWTGWLHLGSSVGGDGPDNPNGNEAGNGIQGNLGLPNFFGNIIESFSNLFGN